MRRDRQQALFSLPVEERHLADDVRTILEAIDRRGDVSVREAGMIVYRIRGWRIPRDSHWLTHAGHRALAVLRQHELVKPTQNGRWTRTRSGARAAEGNGLLSRPVSNGRVGSNPTLTAGHALPRGGLASRSSPLSARQGLARQSREPTS